jgi:hypothetical protein
MVSKLAIKFYFYWDAQKSVKYVSASKINASAQPDRLRRGPRRWRRERYFPHIYQGLERAWALVNLPARRFRRRSFRRGNAGENVRDKLTSRCRHSRDAHKMRAAFPPEGEPLGRLGSWRGKAASRWADAACFSLIRRRSGTTSLPTLCRIPQRHPCSCSPSAKLRRQGL